ncbi:hypothetical protein I79_010928 [Cricetulus griseus]|uniref:Uncharacterized protein n=1 Tax=Cricetulus griseus TaxID=10029 RepID=G3HJS8_CRIGR|nr:hypothetical protein I79_010928 [Cricetulus griseus]
MFLRQGLTIQLWLSWNSLCRKDWTGTHRNLPASASRVLPLKGLKVCAPTPGYFKSFLNEL